MARNRNAERIAVRQKTEASHSGPAPIESSQPVMVKETAQVVSAELDKVAKQHIPEERLIQEEQSKKHTAEGEAGSEESPADKWPRLEESDVVVPFVIQPKIKNTPISSDASALKDPATVGRIVELGRRQHEAIERIGHLKSKAEGERSRAEFEVMRAVMESAQAEAEKERAQTIDRLRSDAEERANASEELLNLAKEALAKINAELEELRKAKEKADSEASAALEGDQGI
ncbi:uncharacterized protein LOC114272609 [Camellia sinensis]|uniref:uncharacterized protein LOC114272609 n=1 Tax=Camellia sinensis TaxID=4442 RepID=UPI00103562CF|nr:uncharacterized protein LOC114272609 [Camellia sinensis]